MTTRSFIAATASAALAAAAVTAGALPAAAHGEHEHVSAVPPRVLAEARAATAAFHDPAKAVAAGYIPTDQCHPGMGQHWVNPAYLMAGTIDASKPPVLLYQPTSEGVRLVGVEWFQVDADQDLATDDDRPDLAGVPFDGPMLGHEPGMPIHYDLHVWIWKPNPTGMTSPENPRVTC